MTHRLISGTILIGVLVLLLRLDYWAGKPEVFGRLGMVLSVVSLFLVSLATSEFLSLWLAGANQQDGSPNASTARRRLPPLWLVMTSSVIMIGIACCLPAFWVRFGEAGLAENSVAAALRSPFFYSIFGLVVATCMTWGYEMFRFGATSSEIGEVTDRLSRAVLIYIYLTLLFGFLIPHRWLEGDNATGLVALIGMIAVIKMSDSMAFFAGKAMGTIKLAPNLSPKKTIQGALGGYLGGGVATAIVFGWVAPSIFGLTVDKPWWWFVVYSLLITTAGILGDLGESLLKRDMKCKDSSSWIPGLGGILDVLDSIVWACPVSYLLWVIV